MANAILFNGGGVGAESASYTATAENVLSDYRYIGADTNDEVGTGTMPNNGAQNATVGLDGKIYIAKGYHNGQGTISATNLKECWADPNYVGSGGDLAEHHYCTVHSDGVITTRTNSSDTRHTACDLTPKRTFYVKIFDGSLYRSITWKFIVPENMNFKDMFGRMHSYIMPRMATTDIGESKVSHTGVDYYEIPSYAYPTGVSEEGGSTWYLPRFVPCSSNSSGVYAKIYVSDSDTDDYLSIYNKNLVITKYYQGYGVEYLRSAPNTASTTYVNALSYPAEGQMYYTGATNS